MTQPLAVPTTMTPLAAMTVGSPRMVFEEELVEETMDVG
jgi:hypothetical protein